MALERLNFGGENVSGYAIVTDFEKLLTKFTSANSVRYEWFLQVWKEMSMSLFYAGRQNDRECREFTEECLRVASTYVLPPYQFQVRVCGLYLLYALYFRHPFEPKVKIRITLVEWKELLSFLGEIHQQQHFDVEYVFTQLRHDQAFHFVASKTELYPGLRGGGGGGGDAVTETQQQKVDMIVDQTSAISDIFQPDAIEELSTIHEEYHRHKCCLAGIDATQPDPSFNIINASLVHDITKAVASHENWRKNKSGKKLSGRRRRDSGHTTNSESEGESEQDQQSFPTSPAKTAKSVGAIRAEIKARAFSTAGIAAQSRRHRQAQVISPENAARHTSPRKRGRKSHASGNPERTPSPTDADVTTTKETSAFGAFIAPQRDKDGVLSMPNLLGDDMLKDGETKKRKNPDAGESSKSKKGRAERLEKRKRSPKDKQKRSSHGQRKKQNSEATTATDQVGGLQKGSNSKPKKSKPVETPVKDQSGQGRNSCRKP